MQKNITASAVISELQSSDMYLSVRGRLCDTKTNANGHRVTEAFIDEIVANQDKYVGIPLCADVRSLINGNKLGHMYNKLTNQFMSAIIGSMYSFEKITASDGVASLIIEARIMKRYKAICEALTKLFADNKLKFSFELSCGAYSELDDGTILIDANEQNFLEGAAVVTFPACEDAVAMQLVAECLGKGDATMEKNDERIAEEAMQNDAPSIQLTESLAEEDASEPCDCEAATENAENEAQTVEAEAEKKPEPHEEKCNAETETAEIYMTQEHKQTDVVHMYDTETKVCVTERTETQTIVDGPMEEGEGEEISAACKKKKDKTECACESNYGQLIAQMQASIEAIVAEIASLREMIESKGEAKCAEQKEVIAEADDATSLVNPFMAETGIPSRYALLEPEGKRENYTLLNAR